MHERRLTTEHWNISANDRRAVILRYSSVSYNYDLFNNDSDINSDEENILNIRRGQKSMRFIISSESENEEELTETDGTVWQKIK